MSYEFGSELTEILKADGSAVLCFQCVIQVFNVTAGITGT